MLEIDLEAIIFVRLHILCFVQPNPKEYHTSKKLKVRYDLILGYEKLHLNYFDINNYISKLYDSLYHSSYFMSLYILDTK